MLHRYAIISVYKYALKQNMPKRKKKRRGTFYSLIQTYRGNSIRVSVGGRCIFVCTYVYDEKADRGPNIIRCCPSRERFLPPNERERERAVRAKVNTRRESEIDTIWKLEEERVRDHLIFLPFGMRLPNIHT